MTTNTTQQTLADTTQTAAPEITTDDELIAAAREYATAVVNDYDMDVPMDDLEWEVSHRAKRRGGACKYRVNSRTGDIEKLAISLTWEAHEKHGWEETKDTIRHELVHCEQVATTGTGDHGAGFKRRARELDASLTCKSFTDARYILVCAECGSQGGERHQASKIVKNPEQYSTSACPCPRGSGLHVTDTKTGDEWTSNSEFRAAR